MLVPAVLKKKLRSVGPVIIEGKLLRRTGYDLKLFMVWLDRKIGYGVRSIVMPFWKMENNRIMFFPYSNGIQCNLKYISNEIIRRKLPVDIYWSHNNCKRAFVKVDKLYSAITDGEVDPEDPAFLELQEYVREHVHFVRPNSYEYFRAAATSRILLTNSVLGDKFYPFPVKKGQLVVETWHGSLGIKRFDLAHYKTNMSWPAAAVRTGKLTTCCITNSTFEEDVFHETFWPDKPLLRLGHARNDIFFDNRAGERAYLREVFIREHPSLEGDEHFVLYAPTFRDSHNFNVYKLDVEEVLQAFSDRFGGKWKLLLRFHDNDKKTKSTRKNKIKGPDVINVTRYADMQEVLAFTDAAITDYSSWIYDYILTGKPGFTFAMDIEKYNNERGFYFTLEEAPFPIATDSEQLAENIRNFDEVIYRQRVDAFLKEKGCMDDGHASERIVDQIEEWLNLEK